jgi:hypothetical protein
MSSQMEGIEVTAATAQTSWRQFFRGGGIAFLVAGSCYAALIPLGSIAAITGRGGGRENGQDLIDQALSNGTMLKIAMVLFIITDLSVIVAFPALATALRKVNRPLPLVATVLATVAMLLDIMAGLLMYSVTGSFSAYTSASDEVRSAYLATAEVLYQYVYKVETPFEIIALSLGVILMSFVMLNGVFSKRAAYIGIGIGAAGVVAGVLGLLVAPLLLSVWYVTVGIQLYKLDGSPHL